MSQAAVATRALSSPRACLVRGTCHAWQAPRMHAARQWRLSLHTSGVHCDSVNCGGDGCLSGQLARSHDAHGLLLRRQLHLHLLLRICKRRLPRLLLLLRLGRLLRLLLRGLPWLLLLLRLLPLVCCLLVRRPERLLLPLRVCGLPARCARRGGRLPPPPPHPCHQRLAHPGVPALAARLLQADPVAGALVALWPAGQLLAHVHCKEVGHAAPLVRRALPLRLAAAEGELADDGLLRRGGRWVQHMHACLLEMQGTDARCCWEDPQSVRRGQH